MQQVPLSLVPTIFPPLLPPRSLSLRCRGFTVDVPTGAELLTVVFSLNPPISPHCPDFTPWEDVLGSGIHQTIGIFCEDWFNYS